MNRGKVIGLVLIFAGIFLCLESTLSATGYVVLKESLENSFALFGLFFLIVGSVLFLVFSLERVSSREEKAFNNLSSSLRNDSFMDYNHLKKEISRLGYIIKNGTRHEEIYTPEGNHLLSRDGHPLGIPRHRGDLKKGLYRSLLKEVVRDYEHRHGH